MNWIDIMATEHPFLLLLFLITIILTVGAVIVDCVHGSMETTSNIGGGLVFMWILAGVAYILI